MDSSDSRDDDSLGRRLVDATIGLILGFAVAILLGLMTLWLTTLR